MKTTICFSVVKTTGSCENNWLFIGEVQARADGPKSRKKLDKINKFEYVYILGIK